MDRATTFGTVFRMSVGVDESMPGVGGEHGGYPVSPVEVAPCPGEVLAGWEQAPGQGAAPAPGLGGQAEAHGRGVGVGAPLGASLHEVSPDDGQEEALHERVEAPAEGDGLAAMVGDGVADEAVQGIDGEHRPVAGAGLGGAWRSFRAATGVGEALQPNPAGMLATLRGAVVRGMAVARELEAPTPRAQRQEQLDGAGARALVASAAESRGPESPARLLFG